MGQESPTGTPSLQDRINKLFSVHRPPNDLDREYRNREVVAACKANGRDISESHLSELRRGVKENPTLRILEALAWFFQVRVAYFTDPQAAEEIEAELEVREAQLRVRRDAAREAKEDLARAATELQRAIRVSGVTKTAHRGANSSSNARQQAAMMRALAQAILDDAESDPD